MDGLFIKLNRKIVRRNGRRSVTCSAQQDFFAKTAIFIHLKDINGNVRRPETFDPGERLAPGMSGLAGKSRDKVQVDVVNTGVQQSTDILFHCFSGMTASRLAEFGGYKRLHA